MLTVYFCQSGINSYKSIRLSVPYVGNGKSIITENEQSITGAFVQLKNNHKAYNI